MSQEKTEKDILESLLEGFNPEGTHPEFPVRKDFEPGAWGRIPWSELAIELPALVVYEAEETKVMPGVGLVVALSHGVSGTEILVRSKHNGENVLHPLEAPPSGLKPAYLLVKNHIPMAGIP